MLYDNNPDLTVSNHLSSVASIFINFIDSVSPKGHRIGTDLDNIFSHQDDWVCIFAQKYQSQYLLSTSGARENSYLFRLGLSSGIVFAAILT